MPQVDFTLEDVRMLILDSQVQEREHAKELIDGSLLREREHTKELIAEALLVERQQTRMIVREEIETFSEHLGDFLSDNFDELRARLGRLESQVRNVNRVVRKHSADIAELQARQGL